MPVPVVAAPELGVIVQVPVAGNPLNTTLPVANKHVGCVMVPTIGAGILHMVNSAEFEVKSLSQIILGVVTITRYKLPFIPAITPVRFNAFVSTPL